MNRRTFLYLSGIVSAYAFSGSLRQMLLASKNTVFNSKMMKDSSKVLDIHRSLSYNIISTKGQKMSDGYRVPGNPDGMSLFNIDQDHSVLVRNHELGRTSGRLMGPFTNPSIDALKLGEKHYDKNAFGGTTNILLNNKSNEVVKEYLSLSGTMTNCAGGSSPWGTWLTCEENIAKKKKDKVSHGYVFEVDPKKEFLQTPVPLKKMGRFNHEAVAFDKYGCAYLTEDRSDGLIYKFIPKNKNSLDDGDLYALKISKKDSRNWKNRDLIINQKFNIEWVRLEDIDPDSDTLRDEGIDKGATIFARGEGIAQDGESIFITCTSGGMLNKGQIWKITPRSTKESTLELWFEVGKNDMLNMPDNLTVAPWGDLIVCEDNPDIDRLWGIKPNGESYLIAENNYSRAELAGVCFNPQNNVLYLNIQQNGQTLAIDGDWNSVRS
jgi:secreted PhoX family phosphatase